VLGAESGMGSYGARLVAAHPERLPSLVSSVILLRVLYGLPIYLMVLAVAWQYRVAGLSILAINGLSVLLAPLYLQWVFQGLRQMQWVATGAVLRNLAFIVVIVLLVRPGSDIRLVAAAEITGAAVLAGYNVYILFRRLKVVPAWAGVWADTRDLFRNVWYLGLGDLAWAGLWYGPTIIVGWIAIAASEQVAWIAAAVRIVVALHTFVWLYFFNLLPNLAREWAAGPEAWRHMVERSLRLSMWPACLVAVGGTLAAPIGIPLVYRPEYAAAVVPFQIVIWMIPVMWFSGHFRFSLLATGHQRWDFGASAIAALTVAPTAWALASAYGSRGAAAAMLLGAVVNAAVALWASARHNGVVNLGATTGPAIGATALALASGLAASSLAGSVAGTLVGVAIFGLIGLRQKRELSAIRELLTSRPAR
jgi:O-antigen/teichoic acid export membrane protein